MPKVLSPVDDTVGANSVGLAFALIIGGIVVQQAFVYYRQFPLDKKRIKILVGILTLLNLFDCGCIMYSNYYWPIETWGNLEKVYNSAPITDCINFVTGGLITFLVEAFYAYRIYCLSKWAFVCTVIGLLTVIQFSMNIAIAAHSFVHGTPLAFDFIIPVIYTWVITISLSDLLIVTSVMYYCQKATGVISPQLSWFNLISIICVQSNLVTALVAITCGVCIITLPNDLWGNSLYYVTVKMFLFSLFAALNSRPSTEENTFVRRRSSAFTTPMLTPNEPAEQRERERRTISSSPQFRILVKDCQPILPEPTLQAPRTLPENTLPLPCPTFGILKSKIFSRL